MSSPRHTRGRRRRSSRNPNLSDSFASERSCLTSPEGEKAGQVETTAATKPDAFVSPSTSVCLLPRRGSQQPEGLAAPESPRERPCACSSSLSPSSSPDVATRRRRSVRGHAAGNAPGDSDCSAPLCEAADESGPDDRLRTKTGEQRSSLPPSASSTRVASTERRPVALACVSASSCSESDSDLSDGPPSRSAASVPRSPSSWVPAHSRVSSWLADARWEKKLKEDSNVRTTPESDGLSSSSSFVFVNAELCAQVAARIRRAQERATRLARRCSESEGDEDPDCKKRRSDTPAEADESEAEEEEISPRLHTEEREDQSPTTEAAGPVSSSSASVSSPLTRNSGAECLSEDSCHGDTSPLPTVSSSLKEQSLSGGGLTTSSAAIPPRPPSEARPFLTSSVFSEVSPSPSCATIELPVFPDRPGGGSTLTPPAGEVTTLPAFLSSQSSPASPAHPRDASSSWSREIVASPSALRSSTSSQPCCGSAASASSGASFLSSVFSFLPLPVFQEAAAHHAEREGRPANSCGSEARTSLQGRFDSVQRRSRRGTTRRGDERSEVFRSYEEDSDASSCLDASRRHGRQKEVTTFLSDLYQQTQRRSPLPFQLFLRRCTSLFCTCWGLLLVVLGLGVFYLSGKSQEFVVPYESGVTTTPLFQVPEHMDAPVFVYYRINDFYGNYRPYLKDGPESISTSYKCDIIRSQREALDFRTFNGVLTLPTLGRSIDGKPIPEDSPRTFPCGLQSLSLFNDKFSVHRVVAKYAEEDLSITTDDIAYHWDFTRFMVRNSTWEKLNAMPWILPSDDRYRVWLHPPFTPSFQKLYGVINTSLEPDKSYFLRFSESQWPAEEWQATKAIVFVSLAPIIGGANYPLAYACLATGGFCLLGVILLWLFYWCGLRFTSRTVRETDMESVIRQAEGDDGVDLPGAGPGGLEGTASPQAADPGARVISGGDVAAAAPFVARNFPEPIACVCPFHCPWPEGGKKKEQRERLRGEGKDPLLQLPQAGHGTRKKLQKRASNASAAASGEETSQALNSVEENVSESSFPSGGPPGPPVQALLQVDPVEEAREPERDSPPMLKSCLSEFPQESEMEAAERMEKEEREARPRGILAIEESDGTAGEALEEDPALVE
ncbi:UNVERIFIED_CONTAM: hypothetical protein HHA_247380 [Hammondia hammondi]|eukprot:XP_008883778.1 hypothetical protein HHA_247380 [Hammondia hammondi]